MFLLNFTVRLLSPLTLYKLEQIIVMINTVFINIFVYDKLNGQRVARKLDGDRYELKLCCRKIRLHSSRAIAIQLIYEKTNLK